MDDDTPTTKPLPKDIVLALADFVSQSPNPIQQQNPHDFDWQLKSSFDQGESVNVFERYVARFESVRGFYADYFYYDGQWNLGAN